LPSLAVLFAGYSIVCAVAIALAHFGGPQYRDQPQARAMGLLLLAALTVLQAAHFAALELGAPWVGGLAYRAALFTVAPSFYLFSGPLLDPAPPPPVRAAVALHALPVLLSPLLTESAFIALHASAIGLAFLLVQIALGLRPQLPAEVREAAQQSRYASTTLAKVDCDAAIARLEALMGAERLYADPELSLPGLAARVDLSAHQLSELLNARVGKSFARYLRERRIAAAKAMLHEEPSASVLSVGLSVGFTSQSNFYEAFREIEGTTPGQFRKLRRR